MRKTKPNIDKGSEYGGTGRFRLRQAKSRNFIRKKEKPVGEYEDIKSDVFDLVPQDQTKLYANSLKLFYYIFGIKVQNNWIGIQYSVKNLSNQTIFASIEPVLEAGKTDFTVIQKKIMDAKINKHVYRE